MCAQNIEPRKVTPDEFKRWILLKKPPAKLVQQAKADLPAALNDLLGLDLRGRTLREFVPRFVQQYRHSNAATQWAICELLEEGRTEIGAWDPARFSEFIAAFFYGLGPGDHCGDYYVIGETPELRRWWEEGQSERGEQVTTLPRTSTKPSWDKHTEARNKWLYEQCYNIVPYKDILRALKDKPQDWERIESVQGVRKAARTYAMRHGLELPPLRQRGRPSREE